MTALKRRLNRLSRLARPIRRFAGARDGNTAVEFAFVAAPFLLLLFAVLEITFMFFITTTLENATLEAARRIRTGEMQMSGASATDFQDAVCEGIVVLVTCEDHLYVDARVYDDFDAVNNPSPVADGEFDESTLQVDFGDAGDIVVVRVFYVWRVIVPDFGTGLANLTNGRRLLVASTAFRNEPFRGTN